MNPGTLTLIPSKTQASLRDRVRLRSEELFRGHNELIIEHQGQEYRLRLTRNDKLILNK